uniref:Uncharacterized protein n=2 Tax=Ceratitis capitata TaxID=7213 RepID=W8BMG2_CERCA
MAEHGNIKVCYRKQITNINYEATNRYEQIIKLIIQRFNIPPAHEAALLISTENGRIFEKQQFDYFLTLFPNPNITFYIRYDYNRAMSLFLQSTLPQEEMPNAIATEARACDAQVKHEKVNPANEDDQSSIKFTPVYRMNCFIYEYPTKLKSVNGSGVKKRKPSIEKRSPRSEFVKRVKKRLQIGEMKKHSIKPLQQIKRFMRL